MNPNSSLEDNNKLFCKRNRWKGEIYQEGNSIIKSYGKNSFISKLYGMISLKLETTALKQLEGIEGIPAFQGRPTSYSIKMEAVPGIPIALLQKGDLNKIFFDRLVSLFRQIHARGVAHGDAHMRNIIAYHDRPYLVDFSTAYVKGLIPLLDPKLFNWMVLLDTERLYKVEKYFFNSGDAPKMFFIYRMCKMFKE